MIKESPQKIDPLSTIISIGTSLERLQGLKNAIGNGRIAPPYPTAQPHVGRYLGQFVYKPELKLKQSLARGRNAADEIEHLTTTQRKLYKRALDLSPSLPQGDDSFQRLRTQFDHLTNPDETPQTPTPFSITNQTCVIRPLGTLPSDPNLWPGRERQEESDQRDVDFLQLCNVVYAPGDATRRQRLTVRGRKTYGSMADICLSLLRKGRKEGGSSIDEILKDAHVPLYGNHKDREVRKKMTMRLDEVRDFFAEIAMGLQTTQSHDGTVRYYPVAHPFQQAIEKESLDTSALSTQVTLPDGVVIIPGGKKAIRKAEMQQAKAKLTSFPDSLRVRPPSPDGVLPPLPVDHLPWEQRTPEEWQKLIAIEREKNERLRLPLWLFETAAIADSQFDPTDPTFHKRWHLQVPYQLFFKENPEVLIDAISESLIKAARRGQSYSRSVEHITPQLLPLFVEENNTIPFLRELRFAYYERAKQRKDKQKVVIKAPVSLEYTPETPLWKIAADRLKLNDQQLSKIKKTYEDIQQIVIEALLPIYFSKNMIEVKSAEGYEYHKQKLATIVAGCTARFPFWDTIAIDPKKTLGYFYSYVLSSDEYTLKTGAHRFAIHASEDLPEASLFVDTTTIIESEAVEHLTSEELGKQILMRTQKYGPAVMLAFAVITEDPHANRDREKELTYIASQFKISREQLQQQLDAFRGELAGMPTAQEAYKRRYNKELPPPRQDIPSLPAPENVDTIINSTAVALPLEVPLDVRRKHDENQMWEDLNNENHVQSMQQTLNSHPLMQQVHIDILQLVLKGKEEAIRLNIPPDQHKAFIGTYVYTKRKEQGFDMRRQSIVRHLNKAYEVYLLTDSSIGQLERQRNLRSDMSSFQIVREEWTNFTHTHPNWPSLFPNLSKAKVQVRNPQGKIEERSLLEVTIQLFFLSPTSMTQNDIATLLGVDGSTISRLINNATHFKNSLRSLGDKHET